MKNAIYENKSEPLHISVARSLAPLRHLHKEIEIIYVKDGCCKAYADRNCTTLKNGDLFVCFPNQVHYYEEVQIGEYYLIILSPDIFFGLKNLFNENVPKNNVIEIGLGTELDELLEKALLKSTETFGETVSVGLLNQVIGSIFNQFKLKPRIKTDNSTLQNILNYCNRNFTSELILEDVAEALHLSKYHISRLFNNKLGISLNTYINTLRINEACDLLEDTDKKTTDISEEIGFGSIRSFNRAFLQIMDMSPLQYRKLVKSTNTNNNKT